MENEPQLWNGNLLYGLLLVVSNVAIFPAIWLAARRGHMTTVLLYCNTFIASVAYHYCRAFDQCLTTYELHVITDYISVYMVIVWILTTLGLKIDGLTYFELHNFVFFAHFLPVMYTVLWEASRSWLPIVGIGVPVFTMVMFSYKTHNRLFFRKPWTIVTFVLIALAGLFMFVMPRGAYGWAHTLWHIFSMLAAFTFELATDPSSPDSTQLHVEYLAAQAQANPRLPVAAALARAYTLESASEKKRRRPSNKLSTTTPAKTDGIETGEFEEIPSLGLIE